MSEENSHVLQELIMQTMDNVRELTKQFSEVKTLLSSSMQNNNDINKLLVERADRHREEINKLKDDVRDLMHSQIDLEEYDTLKADVDDLQESRSATIKVFTIIGGLIGTILTSAAAIFIDKFILK